MEAVAVEIPAGAGVAGVKAGAGGPAERGAEVEGGSIGLLVYKSTVRLSGCAVQTARGAKGGVGGTGQRGQVGGVRGVGGGTNGCNGGGGGVGGAGGGGGGGAGGVSIGIGYIETAPVIEGVSTADAVGAGWFTGGAAGVKGGGGPKGEKGGSDGLQGDEGTGGVDGVVGAVKALPGT